MKESASLGSHQAVGVPLCIVSSALVVLGACTTIDPVFVSEPLMISNYAKHEKDEKDKAGVYYGDLPAVIDEVNRLRFDLMSAVRKEVALPNGIGAALIPLSAVAMYRGLTANGGFDEKWLAAAGLIGASAYAYGATLVSKPRTRIYLAGVDALSCTLLAFTPFLYRSEDVDSDPRGLRPALRTLGERMAAAQVALDQSLEHLTSRQAELANAAIAPAKTVCSDVTPSISHIGTGQDPQPPGRSVCRQIPAKDKIAAAPYLAAVQQVRQTLRGFEKEVAKAAVVHEDGTRLLRRIEGAGQELREKAIGIQTKMAIEIHKTEPDLGAILMSLGSLRGIGYQISGAQGLAQQPRRRDDAVKAESLETKPSTEVVDAEMTQANVSAAAQAIDALRGAVGPVREHVQLAAASSEQTAKIAHCRIVLPTNQLAIVPDVEEVVLAAGGSQAFIVSGGTGAPLAELAGAGTDRIDKRIDIVGSVHKVTVALKGDASIAASDKVYLHLADSNGNAKRVIRIIGETVNDPDGKQPNNKPSRHSEKTMGALCAAFGTHTTDCEADAKVQACRRLVNPDIDAKTPITETEARKLTEERTKATGKCHSI